MDKLFNNRLFPLLTVVISITIGLVLYFLGAGFAIAVLVTILVELWITIHRSISKVTDLEKMHGYSAGMSAMSEVIPVIHKIMQNKNKWSDIVLSQKLEKLLLDVDCIEKQRIQLNLEDFMDFADVFFNKLNRNDEIFATSLFGGGNYWDKKYGQRYAKLNQTAIQKGASITRIFIHKDTNDKSRLEETLKKQSANSIKVRTTDLNELNEINKSSIKDFFILNEELVTEFHFDHQFNEIASISVIISKEEVRDYSKKMKKLIELSHEYKQ